VGVSSVGAAFLQTLKVQQRLTQKDVREGGREAGRLGM
jgi:hypothetical protein